LEGFAQLGNSDRRLRLTSLEWLGELPLRHGEPVKARIHFKTLAPVKDVVIGIGFSMIEGRRLLTYDSDFQGGRRLGFHESGSYFVDMQIDSLPLAPDIYSLDIGARWGDFGSTEYIPGRVWVDVVPGRNTPGHIVRNFAGVRLGSTWAWNNKDVALAPIQQLKVLDQR
jgi:hypothetical protein